MAILTLKASPSYKYALCLTARPAPNLLYFKVGPFWPLAPHVQPDVWTHVQSCLDMSGHGGHREPSVHTMVHT